MKDNNNNNNTHARIVLQKIGLIVILAL